MPSGGGLSEITHCPLESFHLYAFFSGVLCRALGACDRSAAFTRESNSACVNGCLFRFLYPLVGDRVESGVGVAVGAARFEFDSIGSR